MAPQRGTRSSKGSGSKNKKKVVTILTSPFRIGFNALLVPEDTDNGERYSVTMLFPDKGSGRETPETMDCIDDIHKAFEDVMTDHFGDEADWPGGKKDTLPEDKFYKADKKDYAGFKKNWWVLKAASTDAPGVVGPDKQEVINKREVYNGRWARAQIAITTFDNASKGCTAYLNHVQLLDHDEAFSGRGSAEDAFDKYEIKDDGRKRGRDRDEDDEDDRGSRGRGRGRDDDDREDGKRDRGRSREDDDEERRPRRSKDRDEEADDNRGRRDGRRSSADDEAEERPRRGRDRSDDRDDDEPRGRSRGRERDEDAEERPSRGRARNDDVDDERPSSKSRSRANDDERPSSRSRSRSRDDDDERPSSRGRSSGRDTKDDDWN